ncbi:MAG: ABC transporter ATP-binding protein [Thermoprotei archaeon]|nr:MAG: ABC transporter ATP-binding protein [Thermoprotei archaeon]
MSSFVVVRDVWKIYDMDGVRVEALRGASFDVEKGEFLGVVGPSGSGKSTLLHIIGGLDKPTKGEVVVEEVKINELSDEELSDYRNKIVGFVFQMFYLIPRFTALQNVEMPLIARGVPREERRKRALEALEMVGLGDRAFHKPNQLSGGEQQRVAIARAIVGKPKLLLADEPTGNLDSESAKSVMEVFKKLNREYGLTIILVTHNLELVWYCNRVIRLADGRVKKIYKIGEYEEMLSSMLGRR